MKGEAEQTIYNETLVELRVRMEQRNGSVRTFCAANGIDHTNLYKCLNGTRGQEMSIGLFARICSALGNPIASNLTNSNLSLKQYLEIDNNAVWKCLLYITFGKSTIKQDGKKIGKEAAEANG